MFVKVILAIIIGAAIGGWVGRMLRCSGGTCPLTCNPWGGAIYGAAIAVALVLS